MSIELFACLNIFRFQWKIITSSMLCCCKEKHKNQPCTSTIQMSQLMKQEKESRNFFHPADAQIALSTHTPLYLPGRILHIVRNHNRQSRLVLMIVNFYCPPLLKEN